MKLDRHNPSTLAAWANVCKKKKEKVFEDSISKKNNIPKYFQNIFSDFFFIFLHKCNSN
jgi:hypothetical protein